MARVCVDVPLPHLDRPFDYLVPAELSEDAQPGTRVRVRFAGQLVDGWLLDRAESSDHGGRLSFLERLVSPERVLSAEVAERMAAALPDVELVTVPRVGHTPSFEEPESQAALDRLLARVLEAQKKGRW